MDGRITVKQAAIEIGVSQDYIRYMMRNKQIDIGTVVKCRSGRGYRYLIYRPLLDKFLGKNE